MKAKLEGIQIKADLVIRLGDVYYFKNLKSLTIDTNNKNRTMIEKDLIKIVK